MIEELYPALDPRRWITLAIVIISAFIVVLDNTVLNIAIPTILREFHTTLPSLEWVITGYALTFATLLIIGGRLTPRVDLAQRRDDDPRRSDHRGHGRVAHAAGDAGDPVHDVPRTRAGHRVRHVGRDRRRGLRRFSVDRRLN